MKRVGYQYLGALLENKGIDGGIALHKEFDIKNLDFSMDSLKYLDQVIDQIKKRYTIKEDFLEHKANQNLLYALAFYVGCTVTQKKVKEVKWLFYSDAVKPAQQVLMPYMFVTSMALDTGHSIAFPLNAIVDRFSQTPDKSIHFAASIM